MSNRFFQGIFFVISALIVNSIHPLLVRFRIMLRKHNLSELYIPRHRASKDFCVPRQFMLSYKIWRLILKKKHIGFISTQRSQVIWFLTQAALPRLQKGKESQDSFGMIPVLSLFLYTHRGRLYGYAEATDSEVSMSLSFGYGRLIYSRNSLRFETVYAII